MTIQREVVGDSGKVYTIVEPSLPGLDDDRTDKDRRTRIRLARSSIKARRREVVDAIIDRLLVAGMRRGHTVLDIPAGGCDIGIRLRERGHLGMYVPIGMAVDGTDTEDWEPQDMVDWVVGINPVRFVDVDQGHFRTLARMSVGARFGVVVAQHTLQSQEVGPKLNRIGFTVAPISEHSTYLLAWKQ